MKHWIDTLTGGIAPRWTLRRMRARAAGEILLRHFEAAAAGRRTQGWNRSSGDANAATSGAIRRIRDVARDLVRNDPYAQSALGTIVDHAVGWGLVATTPNTRAKDAWQRWAGTPACDAEGRQDFYGLQKQVVRTVVEAGEVLIRRRFRRPEDGLPIPLQLQVLEPDYLDESKNQTTPTGFIVQGVEYNPIGRRIAYWLFRVHPGASLAGALPTGAVFGASERVPASEIIHVFKPERPGQTRGISWFAPVVLKLKDFSDYEDAALMKQKIAACLAVITTDVDGTAPALGTGDDAAKPGIDSLEPGMILNIAPGKQVSVVDPPTVSEHGEYAKTVLRAIAAGLGVTYEDLTGSYDNLPFSAARMSRLRHWARVEDWRWRMLVPQFCDPVWQWAMQAAVIANAVEAEAPPVRWTAPPAPMIDPAAEGLAYQRNIRTGIMTLSEAIRERGYDPKATLQEMADDWKELDRLGLILDSDPRKTTQAGQPRETAATARAGAAPVAPDDDDARLAATWNGGGHR